MTKILNTEMDIFARKYLVLGNEHLANVKNYHSDYNKVVTDCVEKLLYHGAMSIQIYGENIPLTILIRMFGVNGVEALLEQKALEFIFSDPFITYLVDDIPGVMPLQTGGKFTSAAHSDPEESATLGLNWLSELLPRRVRGQLVRKVVKSYKSVPRNIAEHGVEIGYQGYESNLFANLGLPKQKPLKDLNLNERKLLCNLATESQRIALLSHLSYHTYDQFTITKLIQNSADRLSAAKVIEKNTDKIFTIETLPSFKEMISNGIINIYDVPQICSSKNAEKFRSWILKAESNAGSEEITKEYIDAVANSKGFFETNKGKITKSIVVTSVAGIIGSSVAGIPGAVAGVSVGGVAQPLVDHGLSLLDSFILDGLLKGWSPRNYTNEIRQIVDA
ncbi:hypothetical protein [Paenibacillus sp. SAFN-117]|uniref:hypothetical protein n=1 Tax=Paenibacillus sp. SAFN-117 TaxID=3436860 RepID=UPI003F7D6C6F